MFSSLLALLLLVAPVDGLQAPVPAEHRALNKTGVQCVWASLETLARKDGVASLSAMTNEKFGPSNPAEVESVLRAKGVSYDMVQPGNLAATYAFLEKHLAAGRTCAIGVYAGRHCLLCVHFERGVKVVTLGNAAVNGGLKEWTWNEFLGTMQPDGWAFCLTGKAAVAKKSDHPCPCPDGKCKCYPCECGPKGDPTCPCKVDCCPKPKKGAPKVVMPNITVERDEPAKLIYIYRADNTGTRFILPADATQGLIDACKERLDPAARPKITFPVVTPQVVEPAVLPVRPQFIPSCPNGRCQPAR